MKGDLQSELYSPEVSFKKNLSQQGTVKIIQAKLKHVEFMKIWGQVL